MQKLGASEHKKMPRNAFAAFNARDTSRDKLHQLPIGRACECLGDGTRHKRHVADDERVLLGVSQLMKKSLGRVVGRQTLALINLAAGFKQWPEYFRRLFCPGLAAMKNLCDLDVLAREPLCQSLNIDSTPIAQGAVRIDVFRHRIAVLNDIKSHRSFFGSGHHVDDIVLPGRLDHHQPDLVARPGDCHRLMVDLHRFDFLLEV